MLRHVQRLGSVDVRGYKSVQVVRAEILLMEERRTRSDPNYANAKLNEGVDGLKKGHCGPQHLSCVYELIVPRPRCVVSFDPLRSGLKTA